MIFVNSIADLWYYHKKAGELCYCDQLIYPNDLILQDILNTGFTSGYSVEVSIYSPDGLTEYEKASPYFSFYVAVNPNGYKFFNLRCEEYSPAMCTYKCYILRVKISVGANLIFDKYTEQYCQTNCCDIPRGVTITDDTGVSSTTTDVEPRPYAACDIPLITIKSTFECLDNETGLYYGIPDTVLTGTALFSYSKITNLAAKIRRTPREITRVISYNCKLQRSESSKTYLLETNSSEGVVPEWKLNELENMFHGDIEVNDYDKYGNKSYQYLGGKIGERVYICWDMFKVSVSLQECTVRTDFGCGECGISAKEFLIPENASGGAFYTEDRVLIGDYGDLLDYFENIGFTVTDTSGNYDNTFASFTLQGSGVIQNFYYDNIVPRNKVYGTSSPVAPVVSCALPIIGEVLIEEDTCGNVEIGTIEIEDEEEVIAAINDYGDWDVDETTSKVYIVGDYARMNLDTANSNILSRSTDVTNWYDITLEAGDTITDERFDGNTVLIIIYASQAYQRTTDFTQTGDTITMTNGVMFSGADVAEAGVRITTESETPLAGEIIGIISIPGRPATVQTATVGDATVTIDPTGLIRYTGSPTTQDETGSQISITDVYYYL